MRQLLMGVRILGILLGLLALTLGTLGLFQVVSAFLHHGLSVVTADFIFAVAYFVVFVLYGTSLLVPYSVLRRIVPIWLLVIFLLLFCWRIPYGFANIHMLQDQTWAIVTGSAVIILIAISQFALLVGENPNKMLR